MPDDHVVDAAGCVHGASAIAFIGTGRPRRSDPSAVSSTVAFASASRAATASGPKPLKIGTQIAPSFEHAITAATVSWPSA